MESNEYISKRVLHCGPASFVGLKAKIGLSKRTDLKESRREKGH